MTLSVEKKLAAEMQTAGRGSIVHDGWSKRGIHYLALFATYPATRVEMVNELFTEVTKNVISLLSVSPLHANTAWAASDSDSDSDSNSDLDSEDGEDKFVEAVEFTAAVHKSQIVDVLKSFMASTLKSGLRIRRRIVRA